MKILSQRAYFGINIIGTIVGFVTVMLSLRSTDEFLLFYVPLLLCYIEVFLFSDILYITDDLAELKFTVVLFWVMLGLFF